MIETPRQSPLHQKLRLPATEALAMSLEFTQTPLQNDGAYDIGSLLRTITGSTDTVGLFPSTKAETEVFPSIEWNTGGSEEPTTVSTQRRKHHRKLQRRKRRRTGGLVRSQPLLCLTAFDEPHQVSDDEGEQGETSKKRLKMSVLSPFALLSMPENSTHPSTTSPKENNPLMKLSQQKQPQYLSYDTVVGATCTLLPSTPHNSIGPTLDRASLLCECPFPSYP